jgi:tetratricopeptide (TPR) repeat protein
MKHRLFTVWRAALVATALALSWSSVHAEALANELTAEQQKWDHIQYELPANQQEQAFKALAVTAASMLAKHPDRAEAHTWHGVALASQARANGGIGALAVAREARDAFDKAITIDPKVMGGAAYYGLGGLYSNVPRWPIGFGDKKRAEEMFKLAVAVAPDGLDSNYYYGDFLVAQQRAKEARPYLERALQAPDRPGRELADKRRSAKVETLIKNLPTN